MKQRIIAFALAVACIGVLFAGCGGQVMETIVPGPSVDKVSLWDGTIATGFGGGDGSAANPYLINNGAQLAYLSECCKNGESFLGESFKLMANIDLNGREWYPIGQFTSGKQEQRYSNAFQGIFDGNHCYVSNFKINVDAVRGEDKDLDVGLFGVVESAEIKNLTVKHFTYQDNGKWPCVGGLIGRAWENTYVENCHVQNGTIRAKAAQTRVGGLIGSIHGTFGDSLEFYVVNCSADADIIVECSIYNCPTYEEDGKSYYQGDLSFQVGGLIGNAQDVVVYNCYSKGNTLAAMTTDASDFTGDFIGGLIGYNQNAPVRYCYSTATVQALDTQDRGYIGGLIGLAGSSVENCYSAGEIYCDSPQFCCGGLVGGTYDPIKNCFSMTDILAEGEDMSCHTLVGAVEDKKGQVTNCYISADAKIENNRHYDSPRDLDVKEIDPNKFQDKEFLGETLGFEQYDKSVANEKKFYSGWQLADNALPKLFFEPQIEQSVTTVKKDLPSYLGMTAKDVIKDLGDNYELVENSIVYKDIKVSFVLGGYVDTLTGDEEIVNISAQGEYDLGNNLTGSMTFTELKKALGDAVDAPTYMEIDQQYLTYVSAGGLGYAFVWTRGNYDTEKCSFVSIAKE